MANAAPRIAPLTLARVAGLPFAWLERLGGDFEAIFREFSITKTAEEAARVGLADELTRLLAKLPEGSERLAVFNARKFFHQKKKVDWEKLGLAEQLAEQLGAWSSAQKRQADLMQVLENQWKNCLAENFLTLQLAAELPELQRGLVFSSHALLAELPEFARAAPTNFSKNERRVAVSIYQYLARACGKTSPFGKLTTVGLATGSRKDAKTQRIDYQGFASLRLCVTNVTPNAAILEALNDLLLARPETRPQLTLKLNPFVVALAPRYAFIYMHEGRERMQELAANPAVDCAVETFLANGRRLAWPKFQAALAEEIEGTAAELDGFALELVSVGLLEIDWPEKGLSADWAARLADWLRPFSAETVVNQAVVLLDWLNAAARQLPDQSISRTQKMQREAAQRLANFFESQNLPAPPLLPEQVFYEDVAAPPEGADLDLEELLSGFPEAVSQIFFGKKSALEPSGETWTLPEFFKKWQAEKAAGRSVFSPASANPLVETGHLALLFQPFRGENGQIRAVVNAWAAGGGKLFGRWLPLFSDSETEGFRAWLAENSETTDAQVCLEMLPSAWSNLTAFSPLAERSLDWPGGKLPDGQSSILPGELEVRQGRERGFELFWTKTGQGVRLSDPSLEAWPSRPPFEQMLLELGVPDVSLRRSLDLVATWAEVVPGVWHRAQVEISDGWVFGRASWRISDEIWRGWLAGWEASFFLKINELRAELGWPRHLFFTFSGGRAKPQFLDLHSPISVWVLEKKLASAGAEANLGKSGGGQFLTLTEMLPAPDQLIFEKNGLAAVGELAVELRV